MLEITMEPPRRGLEGSNKHDHCTGCNCRTSVIRERVTEVELLSHKQFDETIGDPATNVRMITPGVVISSTHWSLSPSEV